MFQYDETLKCLFNGTKLQVFTLRWLQVGAACDSGDGDTVRDVSRGVRYVTLCHAHTILHIITTGHGMPRVHWCHQTQLLTPRNPTLNLGNADNICQSMYKEF